MKGAKLPKQEPSGECWKPNFLPSNTTDSTHIVSIKMVLFAHIPKEFKQEEKRH